MANQERIDARVAREQKRLIARAAEITGLSVAGFVVSSAIENAQRVIADHTRTSLSLDNARKLIALLDDDEPNAALLSAAARYRTRKDTHRARR